MERDDRRPARGEHDEESRTPPDANDELGQYEGSYEGPGAPDRPDEYGTGGGDVGIGGDVSPHGAMHDAAATAPEVEELGEIPAIDAVSQTDGPFAPGEPPMSGRAADLDLVSDDLTDQGIDEAWPRDEGELPEGDPRASFDETEDPATSIRDEDDLDQVA
jgi:hypothetical protein